MEVLIFVVFAVITLASSVVVITHRNPVHSTMALVVTLVSLAAFFVLLGAPFIAALQILIYTGAILVLFLFVIMLLNISQEEITGPAGSAVKRWGAILASVVFAAMVGAGAWNAYSGVATAPLDEEFVSLKVLAAALFGRYLLPFEIVGLLLLVAVIAATVLARKPAPPTQEETQP